MSLARAETSFDLSFEEAGRVVAAAHGRGLEVASIDVQPAAEPRLIVVLRPAKRPEEEVLVTGVALGRAEAVVAARAKAGQFPTRIALGGGDDARELSIVFRRGLDLSARLIGPRALRDVQGRLFFELDPLAVDPGYLVVDVAGFLATGEQPRIIAVVRASEQRVRWAVHVDDIAPAAWPESEQVRALSRTASPVRAIPLSSDRVLSLWHDVVFEPWPEPHPFAERTLVHARAGNVEALRQVARTAELDEDRRLVSVGSSPGGELIGVFGGTGRDTPLERQWHVTVGDVAAADAADEFVAELMRKTGARHGQLAIARGEALVIDRAYTFAEEGYPQATGDHYIRVGSVSKVLTTLAALSPLAGWPEPLDLDEPVLRTNDGGADAEAYELTLRHLLTHRSGLRTVPTIRHDEPGHALSEKSLATLSGGAPIGGPGDVLAALRGAAGVRAFARRPARAGERHHDYANEGFTLLGEILAQRAYGDASAFERLLVERLLVAAGMSGERGVMFARGARASAERGESPPEPSSPSWGRRRFDDLGTGSLTPVPWTLNGAFIGGAAGIALPAATIAKVVARIGPNPRWSDAAVRRLLEPTVGHERQVLGLLRAPPAFWTMRDGERGLATFPVERVYHNGQIEGGAALVVHQFPRDFASAPTAATLTAVVAISQVGPLFYDTVGKDLLGVLARWEKPPLQQTRRSSG